jgi:predicted alpha/beta superfamily hydrolase
MKNILTLFPSLLFILIIHGQRSFRIELKTLPAYHSSASDIYVSGSFNNWDPADATYKMKKEGDTYFIEASLPDGIYEYKFTRGGWDKVETGLNGQPVSNRSLSVPVPNRVLLKIEGWQDHFSSIRTVSTATASVCILDTAFKIPELDRKRRVWIYLPQDYCDGEKKDYPVLYMHDGQNVFDESSSYSGEWGVDEFLDSTKLKRCIVVAIDHAGNNRMNEYNPFDSESFGRGEGDLYVHFLVKTLKPFIDKRFRTLKKKKDTFIAGSSMGGLISIYALLKYPKVFGAAGIFSPAFSVPGDKIFNDIKLKGNRVDSRIYFYGGKHEAESMVPGILRGFETMAAVSHSVMTTVIRDDGKHNEGAWRKEFPLFYKWIMADSLDQDKPLK